MIKDSIPIDKSGGGSMKYAAESGKDWTL